MSQCLRCSKPCEATAVFCEECRSLLRNEFRQGSVSCSPDSKGAISPVGARFSASSSVPSLAVASVPALIAQEPDGTQDNLAYNGANSPGVVETPRSPGAPVTPLPPTLAGYTDIAEQTMSRMSEAAQIISEVEPSNRRLPRASRLAPMRDISADIRRESTPLPKFSQMRHSTGASEGVSASGPLPAVQEGADNNGEMPDLWPWLDSEVEERENEDSWANGTDPLISRHIPNSIEAARIEEEDIKRALAEGVPTSHNLRLVSRHRASSLRFVFAVLAVLAALALIVDGILFSVVVVHPRHANTSPKGLGVPALTLSPSVVNVGCKVQGDCPQDVTVHIINFPRHHKVKLWHDVQEDVITKPSGGSSVVTIGNDGSAQATLIVNDSVNNNWAVGFDLVYVEDTLTHFSASTQLQVIIGGESSKPAHLGLVGQNGQPVKLLDFGQITEGSNKILPLTLENSGSGSITWSASSNKSWLLVSPGQGMFSQNQKIDVAAQSVNLKPGKYTGMLSLSSNVSAQPQLVQVTMTVNAAASGPVLAVTPAVLSFTTTDGSPVAPYAQTLTLNNPGTQPMNWSLSIRAAVSASNQLALAHMPGISSNWSSTWLSVGFVGETVQTIAAGSSQQLEVSVNSYSNSLLPGAYQGYLVFSAPGAVDGSSQTVAVSLTVQPHCGLVTNSGYLSFTAVQGKTNPGNQSLGLNATASCAGAPISWKAALSSSYNWLSATPISGSLKGTTSEFISVGANATGLPATPKPYYGLIALTTQNSTQTVMVALTVQPRPAQNAPVMSAAPLNLNFSSTYGQPSPKGQVVTITNTGGSTLEWNTNVTTIASSWLYAAPSGGKVLSGQTMQLIVNVDTSHLSPGTYAGQITLNALAPASGGSQVVSINLVVQPACTLTQPSSSALAFSSVQGPYNPISQTVLITGTGNCAWPLAWTATTSAPWLVIQPPSNSIKASGQSSSFSVQPDPAGKMLVAGVYTTSITISATDSTGTVATGSPQTISVTLTVLPPCSPIVASTLNFTAAQGQGSPNPQSVTLSESGTCSRPVSWTAGTSSGWLTLSSPPLDTGSGSPLIVTVNSAGLPAETQTGTITVSATDGNGNAVGVPQTITVTLTVTPTYSVSGTVLACQPGPAPLCTTSAPLPGAMLTVLNSANQQVEAVTADGSGNYSILNLSPGSYTVNISGIDANSQSYSTTGIPLPVAGNNTAGVTLAVFPG